MSKNQKTELEFISYQFSISIAQQYRFCQDVTVHASNDNWHFGDREKSDDDDITKKIDRGEHERNVKASLVLIVLQPIEATNNAAVTLSPFGAVLLVYARSKQTEKLVKQKVQLGMNQVKCKQPWR